MRWNSTLPARCRSDNIAVQAARCLITRNGNSSRSIGQRSADNDNHRWYGYEATYLSMQQWLYRAIIAYIIIYISRRTAL